MKQTEIEKVLSDDLSQEFSADGFKYVKAAKWLARTAGDITQILSWSYYSSAGGFRVAPGVGIRSEAIFQIFKQASPVRKEDEKFRRTLSVEIWRLLGDRSRGEFMIASMDDAHRAAAGIAKLARDVALPFFEKCTAVADIDRVLNTDPSAPATALWSLDLWTRAANATIAAKLAGNPKYDGLVDAYRTMLSGLANGHYLPQYEALLSLL